jgi:acyl-CoA thioesterase-2
VGDLERDTQLVPVAGRDGHYRAQLSRDWEIWGPNGGYLAAIALRAGGLGAAIPRPASFNAHFLRVADFAEVDVRVEALRRGRRSESLRVSMEQAGKPVLEALLRTAADGPGLEHDVAEAPDVADPEGLERPEFLRKGPPPYPFWDNLDARVLDAKRFEERIAEPPLWREWYRFRPRARFDDPFLDAARSLILIDTMSWPAASRPHPDGAFQAPNLDVGVWFHRAAPECEWLLVDHTAPVAEGGLMGTVARVWSRDRKLLASGGAQLLCVPRPG